MAIYVFKCDECNTHVEKIQKYSDAAPECHHKPMVRQLTTPAFNFANGHGTDMGSSMAIPGFPLPPVG